MEDIIVIENLKKSFGEKKVLKGINLKIKEGKTTVILGLSGSGKSTIIKHIVGLLKPDDGKIYFENQEISALNEKKIFEIRKKIGFLFQSGALFDSMNVFENIAFPLKEHTSLKKEEIEQRIYKVLKMVGLKPEEVIKLYPDELSGGMRKRVGLARTIVLKPKVILYDEPTTGLDPITADLISIMIKNLQKELKVTSVLISHDIKESLKCGDYFAFLFDGKIIEYGIKESFFTSYNPYLQQFLNGKSEGIIKGGHL